MDEKMLESTISHLVRPEDLNHHGTLFAGQTAKWLVEAGVIAAARLTGKAEDVGASFPLRKQSPVCL